MTIAIIFALLCLAFSALAYTYATKGANATLRVIGFFGYLAAAFSVVQFWIWDQEPNMALVVMIAVIALGIGLALYQKAKSELKI